MSKVVYLQAGESVKGRSYGRQTMHQYQQQVQRGEVVDLDKLAAEMRVSNPQDGNPLDALDSVIVETKVPAYWGIGSTITEAIHNAKYIRPGDAVYVIRCSHDAYIDDEGAFRAGNSSPYGIFVAEGKVNVNYEVVTYG